jgi:hypothetical protein
MRWILVHNIKSTSSLTCHIDISLTACNRHVH